MSVPKKANVDAQNFCGKLQKTTLPKSTTWEECQDIIYQHYPHVVDVRANCISNGDTTIIKIFKEPGDKEDLLETITVPNKDIFDRHQGEWDYPMIYKLVVEYFRSNWRTLTKGMKKKKTKPQPEQLKAEVEELRIAIKSSKSKDKDILIQEYNKKSAMLNNITAMDSSDSKLEDLRKKRFSIRCKISEWKRKGKDVTSLQKELSNVLEQIKEIDPKLVKK